MSWVLDETREHDGGIRDSGIDSFNVFIPAGQTYSHCQLAIVGNFGGSGAYIKYEPARGATGFQSIVVRWWADIASNVEYNLAVYASENVLQHALPKTFREIANTMDPLDPPVSLRDLNDRYRWLSGDQSFRHIVNRHTNSIPLRFLSSNTYLMNVDRAGIDLQVKPAVVRRCLEWGWRLVEEQYDLMALCEVWEYDFHKIVMSAFGWPLNQHGYPLDLTRWAIGPEASWPGIDSGLLTICRSPNCSIVYKESQPYSQRSGFEHQTQKGILLCRVDVGVGIIDLYSTHMSSDDVDLEGNIQELADFYHRTHNNENVAVITGDLNIDARNSVDYGDQVNYKCYQDLLDYLINKYQLQDIWCKHWGDKVNSGYKTGNYDINGHNPGGYTNSLGDGGFGIPTDAVAMSNCIDLYGNPDSNGYCQEPAPEFPELPGLPGSSHLIKRLDYILVECPTAPHTFNLDVTRIRRRAFKRANPTEYMKYLSDHLGLDVTFIASQR